MSMKLKVALLTALALVASGCAKKVNVDTERNALQTADTEWSKATTTVDGFMAFFGTDAALLPPNEPAVSGADNIRAWASKTMAMPGFGVSWQPNVAQVAQSGDIGYTSGTYDLHATGPTGAPFNDHGKYLTVWRKDTSGAWKVALDTFNSDVPVGGAPADSSAAK